MTEYEKTVQWLAQLAKEPAWALYAKHRATELESLWPGITEVIRAEMNKPKDSAGLLSVSSAQAQNKD
ncbi:hypothetical protein AVMA1855_20125 [Acidovorax sp. SUPP1855]|uniref:hypothetical protein n=1 Tax=Acidovorax sp. SUPP1855 TaxID=431774 RepID=UPI0023DE3FC7|nr:hypothetical protein [Acidovorax sp. SUPP1855]GKS86499.1 hypothetical protein AVMA1855_20125 [Acidovorax sp. SUPP1855]